MMAVIIGIVLAAIVYTTASVFYNITPSTAEIVLISICCGIISVAADLRKK